MNTYDAFGEDPATEIVEETEEAAEEGVRMTRAVAEDATRWMDEAFENWRELAAAQTRFAVAFMEMAALPIRSWSSRMGTDAAGPR